MPVKKRTPKHARLAEMKVHELMHGPGTCLFAGEGYQLSRIEGAHQLSAAERAEMLNEMRDDWERHRDLVLATWAEEPRLTSERPWAENFDTPDERNET